MTITNTTLPSLNDEIKFGRTTLRVVLVQPAGDGIKALTRGRVTHVVGFENPKNGACYLGDFDINGNLDRGTKA